MRISSLDEHGPPMAKHLVVYSLIFVPCIALGLIIFAGGWAVLIVGTLEESTGIIIAALLPIIGGLLFAFAAAAGMLLAGVYSRERDLPVGGSGR